MGSLFQYAGKEVTKLLQQVGQSRTSWKRAAIYVVIFANLFFANNCNVFATLSTSRNWKTFLRPVEVLGPQKVKLY